MLGVSGLSHRRRDYHSDFVLIAVADARCTGRSCQRDSAGLRQVVLGMKISRRRSRASTENAPGLRGSQWLS
jgi:hypothetical protein